MADTPPARRRISRALMVMLPLLVLAGGLVLGGCNAVTRYRVLSFFFDDVPPPPGIAPELIRQPPPGSTPWGKEPKAQGPKTAQGAPATPGAGATPATPAPKPVVYHAPYKQRECTACHASSAGYEPPTKEIPVCGKCHKDHVDWRPDDRVHGPTALGLCTYCHEPHKGQYKKLLTTPVPGLCFQCHSKERVLAQTYHQQGDVTDCTRCHDPHSAGNAYLLADSTTYARGNPPRLPEPKGHAAWSKDICTACHQATQSNALVKDVDKKCLLCHDIKKLAPPGQKLHGAVALGRCTACHTPHRSPLPHLIKPQAEKDCYTCHSPDELDTPSHPQVVRANCLICHRGHYSKLPHLLRPGIPSGR